MEFDPTEIAVQTLEFIWLVIVGLYDYCCSFFRLILPREGPKSIKDEIILVTGSGSGIGKEVCFLLVQNGARKLILWDCNKEANEKTASELRPFGAEVHAYDLDVSDRLRVAETAKKVQSEVGDVTMLYNNAGVTHIGNLLDVSDEQIERTIKINLLSHFWTLKAFLPSMIEKKRGHIITTGSTLGLKGVMTGTAYSASKFGVRGYLEALESEIRHHPEQLDIKFTTIYPFFVDTPLIAGLKVTYRFGFLFRHFSPEHVARKVVDGILHNSHSVFIPWHLPHLLFLENLGPRRTAERVIDFFIKDIKLNNNVPGAEDSNQICETKHFVGKKDNPIIPIDLKFSSKLGSL